MKFEQRKMLIVDDDRSFLELAQVYFSSHQYDVTCVDSVAKSLAAMREERFKVVVLDYSMPQVNGNEIIAMLQQINPAARFIVVTGMLSEDVEDKFRGLGYFAYFEKGQLSFKVLEGAVLKAFDS